MSRALNDLAAGTLFGVALNYKDLLDSRLPEFQQSPYQRPPVKPVLFVKTPNTRSEHDTPVLFLRGVEHLQPGPALSVVIARGASRAKEEEAIAHVADYAIVNEFSLPEDSYYRPAVKAKCRDGFYPFGPQLVPAQEIADLHMLELKPYVNDELCQHNNTANLVRDIPRLITGVSEFITLHAGDVLITDTPEGRVDVHPDDRVKVEIDGLGRLVNSTVAE